MNPCIILFLLYFWIWIGSYFSPFFFVCHSHSGSGINWHRWWMHKNKFLFCVNNPCGIKVKCRAVLKNLKKGGKFWMMVTALSCTCENCLAIRGLYIVSDLGIYGREELMNFFLKRRRYTQHKYSISLIILLHILRTELNLHPFI